MPSMKIHMLKKPVVIAAAAVLGASMFSFASYQHIDSAAAADPTTGTLVITDVQDGEEFSAIRIVEITTGEGLSSQFAPGFSYGENADVRTDRGFAAYSALTDNSAIGAAAAKFVTQITPESEHYETAATGGRATFANLPAGQYLIRSTKTSHREYQNMLGNIVPQKINGGWSVPEAVVVSAKYDVLPDVMVDISIAKNAIPDIVKKGENVDYKLVVTTTGDEPVRNLTIVDKLEQEAIDAGLALNEDVVVMDMDDNVIESAVVSYTMTGDVVTGFSISIPGDLPIGSIIQVGYTGNTESLVKECEMLNTANANADNAEEVSSDYKVYYGDEYEDELDKDHDGIKDPDAPEYTEDHKVPETDNPIIGIISQTGENLPIVLGAIAGIAAIVIIVVVVRRRKNEDK